MDLLVIRHGQSEADILKVIEGRANFNLTELGLEQASLMADWVSRYIELDKIVSSSLNRAKQTAEKLSEATNIPIVFDDDLMEWRNGLIAGLSLEEANKKYPEPIKFPHTAVYGQESIIEFRGRAETALSKIIYENPPTAKIAIISHGGMINMLFRSFLDLPTASETTIASGETGIHHWRIKDNKRSIIKINSLAHIPAHIPCPVKNSY
jgi:2,3-bisphosphoglycerate-dependent phosphoglycerate mutase